MADIMLKLEGAGATKSVLLIPSALVSEVKTAYLASKPVPQKQDPDWVDPEDGTPPDMIDVYGAAEHFLNTVTSTFAATVAQGLARIEKRQAKILYKAMKAAGAFEVLTGE